MGVATTHAWACMDITLLVKVTLLVLNYIRWGKIIPIAAVTFVTIMVSHCHKQGLEMQCIASSL